MSIEDDIEEEAFTDFELVPADTEDTTPDEELEAAIALLDPDVVPDVLEEEEEIPLGKTWMLDHETGQLVSHGHTPVVTRGIGSVIEWCQIVLRIARYEWPIFPDNLGMTEPDRLIGFIDEAERRAQYVADVTDTLLEHDRITEITDFEFLLDPEDPEVMLMSAKLLIDGEVEADLEEIPLDMA